MAKTKLQEIVTVRRAVSTQTDLELNAEGLERGVNCAAIKNDMVSIVSTEKKKVAVEKIKAKNKASTTNNN